VTGGLVIGLALAVAASLTLNGGYLLQHVGAAGAPAITVRRPIATVSGLLTSRLWVFGTAAGLGGWALHILALSRAPLSLVQTFVAGGLALTMPLSAWIAKRRPTSGEKLGVALMAVALALLAIGTRAGPAQALPEWGLAAYLVGAAAVGAVLVALPLGSRRAPALAVAAGALYGAGDVAIKALTAVAGHGGALAVLASPWLLAAAVLSIGAFFCFQRALQSGGALSGIALMSAATNVVSIGGGFAIFHDSLGASPLLAVVHAAAFVLALVGGWKLAPALTAVREG
jgi:drug/metabolite transporter (DMT)-like permease